MDLIENDCAAKIHKVNLTQSLCSWWVQWFRSINDYVKTQPTIRSPFLLVHLAVIS